MSDAPAAAHMIRFHTITAYNDVVVVSFEFTPRLSSYSDQLVLFDVEVSKEPGWGLDDYRNEARKTLHDILERTVEELKVVNKPV